MPGTYNQQTGMVPLSKIGAATGTAVDKTSPDIDECFQPNPAVFFADARPLLDTVQITVRYCLPYSDRPTTMTDQIFVLTLYWLAVLAAQIDEYVTGLPADVQTRFRVAVDQEKANRRAYFSTLEDDQ